MSDGRRHPNGKDLYTPITPKVLELFDRMYAEHGSWRIVCWKGDVRMKVLRTLRRGGKYERKAISLKLMDRLTTGTGVGSVDEFVWFTAEDLVALGVWEPVQYWDVQAKMRKAKGGP